MIFILKEWKGFHARTLVQIVLDALKSQCCDGDNIKIVFDY